MSDHDEINDVSMNGPHVVILGAGASLAALPNGDKFGKKLPLMNNLVRICGIEDTLNKYGIKYQGENFEEVFSDLFADNRLELIREIEATVFLYFGSLELPDCPTIYDYLVLSLREKDVIATFNWDPFLWHALKRNYKWAPMPEALYLHGNVAIGYCLKDRTIGPRGLNCTKCRNRYNDWKLLYPIKTKNYNKDPFIKESWDILCKYLEHAYILTIFGYSGPKADVEALQLMKTAWGPSAQRNLEEVEIIDIKSQDELRITWDPFIHSHHHMIFSDFRESWMANHPRRTCDALWAATMQCDFIDNYPLPFSQDWDQLRQWLAPRIQVELRGGNSNLSYQ